MGFPKNPLLDPKIQDGWERHLEYWHDVIFFCWGWSYKISQTGAEWHVDCGDMVKSKPDVKFQYGEHLGEFHGMSSHSHLAHCRVLPPGEFNVMIPELCVTLQGAASGRINGMPSQSHVSHCRVLPLGELSHDSRATCHIAECCHLAKSVSWSCHIAGCNTSVRHIQNRSFAIFYFIFVCFLKCSLGFDDRRLSYRVRYTC